MNTRLSILALIEILSGLSIGVVILVITYQALKYIGLKRYDIHHNNLAYGIFMASILFSIGYMVSCVIEPLLSLFRLMSAADDQSIFSLIISFLGYGAIYIAGAYASGVVVCWLGVVIYTNLTPIDEFAELKNNNVGVALVVGTIMIVLTLMTRDGVSLLIESQIPYPAHFTQ